MGAALISLREHFRDGSLDDTGGVLALLEQQHGRHGEADGRANLDELLHAPPALASDPRAMRERLVHLVRYSLTMSNDSASRGARVADVDGVADAAECK